MYEVNGIDLSSAEFRFLKGLADIEPGTAFEEDGEMELCGSLASKGLLSGSGVFGAYLFEGLTESGKSFVPDWEAERDAGAKARRADKRHDYMVAAFGAVLGFGLGVLSSYLTNCFGLLG